MITKQFMVPTLHGLDTMLTYKTLMSSLKNLTLAYGLNISRLTKQEHQSLAHSTASVLPRTLRLVSLCFKTVYLLIKVDLKIWTIRMSLQDSTTASQNLAMHSMHLMTHAGNDAFTFPSHKSQKRSLMQYRKKLVLES